MRLLHKWYAKFFGFFWLPCPICGESFGGHEWKDKTAVVKTGHGIGEAICQRCHSEGRSERVDPVWVPMLDVPFGKDAALNGLPENAAVFAQEGRILTRA